MKKRLVQLLLNPYFISLAITLCLIGVMPNPFNKYQANLADVTTISSGTRVLFPDLDGDGLSERFIIQTNILGHASYVIYRSNGDFVDQYNYDHPYLETKVPVWFQDSDRDGFKEVYLITQKGDSLFFNAHEPLSPQPEKISNVFVDSISPVDGAYDVVLNAGQTEYDHLQPWPEVVFALNAGFSGYPRSIYKFDKELHRVLKSPHLTNVTRITTLADIDQDGASEIFTYATSSSNTLDPAHTSRSDHSSWLTLLDDDMEFLFPPLEFKAPGTGGIFPYRLGDSVGLTGVFRSKKKKELPSQWVDIDLKGNIAKVDSFKNDIEPSLYLQYHDFHWLDEKDRPSVAHLYHWSDLFQKIPKTQVTYGFIDLNADTFKEFISVSSAKDQVRIYDPQVAHFSSIPLNNPLGQPIRLGSRKMTAGKQDLVVYMGNNAYTYDYHLNPIYPWRFAIYLGGFALILLLAKLIAKGQQLKMERQRAVEDEISRLQLKTIKNQVDPHFVFNAINTISEMTLSDNKLEADSFICRFSDFMRGTLKHSDRIVTTLEEELEYCKNFIELQRVRYNYAFDYDIQLAKSVDTTARIPKHALFCYVENAIKHGLVTKEVGLLSLGAYIKGSTLVLFVRDNGGGLNGSVAPGTHSTGSGLKIMDKIFKLYTRLTRQKIHKTVRNLTDANGEVSGLQVEIEIDQPKKQKYAYKED